VVVAANRETLVLELRREVVVLCGRFVSYLMGFETLRFRDSLPPNYSSC